VAAGLKKNCQRCSRAISFGRETKKARQHPSKADPAFHPVFWRAGSAAGRGSALVYKSPAHSQELIFAVVQRGQFRRRQDGFNFHLASREGREGGEGNLQSIYILGIQIISTTEFLHLWGKSFVTGRAIRFGCLTNSSSE